MPPSQPLCEAGSIASIVEEALGGGPGQLCVLERNPNALIPCLSLSEVHRVSMRLFGGGDFSGT